MSIDELVKREEDAEDEGCEYCGSMLIPKYHFPKDDTKAPTLIRLECSNPDCKTNQSGSPYPPTQTL